METVLGVVYSSRDILAGLRDLKKTMYDIHYNVYTGDAYDGHFTRMIQELNSTQMDRIDLLYPEDEIEMKYKIVMVISNL